MPTLARPDVDVLEGSRRRSSRPGADGRQRPLHRRHGHTDANAFLRILFSRLGQPHIGGPQAFSFNIPSVRRTGAATVERGAGGMCPRCEGMGSVTDIDLTQLYDETKSLPQGAITIAGYTRGRRQSLERSRRTNFLSRQRPGRPASRVRPAPERRRRHAGQCARSRARCMAAHAVSLTAMSLARQAGTITRTAGRGAPHSARDHPRPAAATGHGGRRRRHLRQHGPIGARRRHGRGQGGDPGSRDRAAWAPCPGLRCSQGSRFSGF